MTWNSDLIIGLVTGAILPIIVALFGREAIGKWLLAGHAREDTALAALIGLAQESVAGWRDANTAVVRMSDLLHTHSENTFDYQARAVGERRMFNDSLVKMNMRLDDMGFKLNTLVTLLANVPEEANEE